MHFKKKENNQSGFTLAELVISVAVIVIISAMSLVSFRSTNKSGSSSMAAQKLASDIRKIQGWALSLKDFDNSISNQSWGIYFRKDSDNYSFYIDSDNNQVCSSNCGSASSERQGEAIKILNNLKINDILLDGVSQSRGQVVFNPPEPLIFICQNNSSQCNYNEIKIILEGGFSVLVNKYGLVDVD